MILGGQGFTETVHVEYDPKRVSLSELLTYYFKIIDPTMLNQQGNDQGIQYRTGIYYDDEKDVPAITMAMELEQEQYDEPLVTEVLR